MVKYFIKIREDVVFVESSGKILLDVNIYDIWLKPNMIFFCSVSWILQFYLNVNHNLSSKTDWSNGFSMLMSPNILKDYIAFQLESTTTYDICILNVFSKNASKDFSCYFTVLQLPYFRKHSSFSNSLQKQLGTQFKYLKLEELQHYIYQQKITVSVFYTGR